MKKSCKVLLSLVLVLSIFTSYTIFGAEADARVNLALNKTVTASNQETADFNAAKAFDGVVDYTKARHQPRWTSNTTLASEANPKWLKVDLGNEKTGMKEKIKTLMSKLP